MSEVEALLAATKQIAIKTIAGSSAADYNVEKAFNKEEVTLRILGLATLRR